MTRSSALLIAVALAAGAALVHAECPNACSGHGDCGAFDMCTCDRNFQGADCSEMVCPYGHAFVTTPQGDLNMDGDRDDNTWKRLSKYAQTFYMNSNTITLSGDLKTSSDGGNVHNAELIAGDLIRVGNQVFEVESVVTSGTPDKIVTTEDSKYQWTGQSVFRWSQTQARPQGTWEMWPGDYFGNGRTRTEHTVDDEGHFYMECSNRGICDRESGACQCFDGYTGRGCQRHACPEDCSGHGTCETVDELRKQKPTMLSNTVRTTKHSKEVYTEADMSATLSAGDWVIIGHYPMQRINTIDKEKFTLYNAFPETLPYGTHVWQVHKYELWDAHKGRACKCDPLYTGNDCSLRVCPFGDDPLTVTSMDPQSSTSSTSTSEYTQRAERQTLYIDSFNGKNTGTFTLTFIDEYGDSWTTRPIPTRVRLSVTPNADPAAVSGTDFKVVLTTAKTDAGSTAANHPGIRVEELSVGDLVQSGQQIRKVTKLTYNDPNTRIHYKEFHFDQYTATWPSTTQVWYRITVAKEIREALVALPNRRILDVTVEPLTRGGILISDGSNGGSGMAYTDSSLALAIAPATGSAKISSARPLSGVRVGDVVRYQDNYRIVTAVDNTGDTTLTLDTSLFGDGSSGADAAASTDANNQFFKQNGMAYDIYFESGCRTHQDCRNNGVDQEDSDGPDATDQTEGNDMGATCHAGGACVCSSASYYGPGCTKTGKGTHAAPRKIVSGDIRNLVCDKSGLTPSIAFKESVTVTRAAPLTITFDGTPAAPALAIGDRVRIGDQVRTIVGGSGATFQVDFPFKEDAYSGPVNIFQATTHIEKVESDDGFTADGSTYDRDLATCVVTDIRSLSNSMAICSSTYAGSPGQTPHCARSQVYNGDTDHTAHKITLESSGVLMDSREVRIGDRIRRITRIADTTNSETWETRTVDSITRDSSSGVVTGFLVTEAFSTSSAELPIFNDGSGTTEAQSCSRRGLCDETTGECQCFAGYTDVDCSVQNSLAL